MIRATLTSHRKSTFLSPFSDSTHPLSTTIANEPSGQTYTISVKTQPEIAAAWNRQVDVAHLFPTVLHKSRIVNESFLL